MNNLHIYNLLKAVYLTWETTQGKTFWRHNGAVAKIVARTWRCEVTGKEDQIPYTVVSICLKLSTENVEEPVNSIHGGIQVYLF